MQLLVYVPQKLPRVEYAFATLLAAAGIADFTLTTDNAAYQTFTGAKINYSTQKIAASEFWLKPVNLLFENFLQEQKIECFNWHKSKAFFATEGDFQFDVFAAAFYLLSRYEEYLPHQPDSYGRFSHESSLAFKEDSLQLPLVNIWLQAFSNQLRQKFPALRAKPAAFRYLPTYDIDIAYSYRHKGLPRNAGGLLQELAEGEWARISERLNVLFGHHKDPFDSYEWLDELHEKHQLQPIYFFLLAQQNKGYDKNILPHKKALKKLVQKHAAKYEVGIHPSWQSGDKPQLLATEAKLLEAFTGKTVQKSRQHYIRMTLPETYRRLIRAGITEEYSMGYGSSNGFRASYCLPYFWYDLQKEAVTSLTVFPFCFMDANSFYEQQYSPLQALEELRHYYKIIRQVNGLLITIFHNQFLGTDKLFEGWKDIVNPWLWKVKRDQEE